MSGGAVEDAQGSVDALDDALNGTLWSAALETGRQAAPGVTDGDGSLQPHWVKMWATIPDWANQLKGGSTENMDLAAIDGEDV